MLIVSIVQSQYKPNSMHTKHRNTRSFEIFLNAFHPCDKFNESDIFHGFKDKFYLKNSILKLSNNYFVLRQETVIRGKTITELYGHKGIISEKQYQNSQKCCLEG
jgi:hypothetical protein